MLSNGVVEAPVVIVADNATHERCAALAAQLHLPLLTDIAAAPPHCLAWLGYTAAHLQLHPIDARQSGPVRVDFVAGATARRALGGAELIVKAVRGRSKQPLVVLDATAGLGRDSFVLASRGFNVVAIERNAVIAALLADGLLRAAVAGTAIAAIASRISLHCGETLDYLVELNGEQRPDVIYLDPMFPPSQKSALVKKEMRLFQQLLHRTVSPDPAVEEQQAAELLRVACATARVRVVVKRPAKAAALASVEPDYAFSGKAIRFDVYTAK